MNGEPERLSDVEALLDIARAQTGLRDLEDVGVLRRARRWLDIAECEGRLSEAGRAGLHALVINAFGNRLRFADDLRRHPEIDEQLVREPLFVTGMPRTGTTKLQRCLARDPRLQSLPFWLALNFARMPATDAAQPDPRISIAAGYIEQIRQFAPDFLAGHPVFVHEPDEEIFWLETDFQSLVHCMRVRAPTFASEVVGQPHTESHSYLRRMLRYAQWQRDDARPWVLKSPAHFCNLGRLFDIFPDATVVHTYRDPVDAMASICRVFEAFRSLHSDAIDREELGAELLAFWVRMQHRHLVLRDDPVIDVRIVDVNYEDICHDLRRALRQVYAQRGSVLSEAVLARLCSYGDEYPQYQLGCLHSHLESYGLTAAQVSNACRDYMDRFAGLRQQSAN